MSYGEPCVPTSDGEIGNTYRFLVRQKLGESTDGITIELFCTSDPEAYVLAMKFLRMVNFAVISGHLKNWKGQPMMYYLPKKGWFFGDDRDMQCP